ncbi:MAG TPA: hypothetical protein VFL29_08645 [Candidatus Dormibacteraeota bacterium]|nr:hypothetical protein [Candidatus Dormibacteraeota bacterium]
MLATAILACGTTSTTLTSGASGGGGGSIGLGLGILATYAIAGTILTAGIVALALIVILSRRHDPRPVPVPAGATLSPDGYYWWDGAGWRPLR